MVMTIRMGAVGLLGLGVLWGCGGTVTRGDTDASGSTNGTGGEDDGSGDFGSGGFGADGGSGGTSASGVGGDSTGGDGSGDAATTRGSGSRNNSASGTTTTGSSSDDSSAAVSASSGVGVSSGAGGQSATGSGTFGSGTFGSGTFGTTANTTIGTGSGGFGGDTTSGVSTFGSISVVTSTSTSTGTTGTSTTGSDGPPELEDFPYLDGCDSLYWSYDTQYCNLGFACPSQDGRTSCWNLGNGELSCECTVDYFWTSYRLEDANLENACAYVASACVAGPDAEGGSPKCAPTYLSQGSNYCNANAECRTNLDVEGADIAKTHSLYTYCEERDDAWVCDCSIPNGSVSVTLDGSSGSSDMCLDALDWCAGDITREGPRECTTASQYAETQSCYANLQCSQAAVAGGVPATVTESYTLSCRRSEGDQWSCDCPGMPSFEVESETGWDACTLGASECTPM